MALLQWLTILKSWWIHSALSTWYAQYLIKKHNLSLTEFDFPAKRVTLAELLRRKYKQKPPRTKEVNGPIVMPVAGIIIDSSPAQYVIQMHLYHYHRIHLPIGGTVYHSTDTHQTTTTIHVNGLNRSSLTIAITTEAKNQVLLLYNSHRNYHLPGTEIGIILSTQATIVIQSTCPLRLLPSTTTEISCLQTIGTIV